MKKIVFVPQKIADLGFCLTHVCLLQLPSSNSLSIALVSVTFVSFFSVHYTLSQLFLHNLKTRHFLNMFFISFHFFYNFTFNFFHQFHNLCKKEDKACAWGIVYLSRTLFILLVPIIFKNVGFEYTNLAVKQDSDRKKQQCATNLESDCHSELECTTLPLVCSYCFQFAKWECSRQSVCQLHA